MTRLAFLLLALPLWAQPDYYQFQIDQDTLSGAPDFSFLNHPLTAADRLFVCEGHFCRVGPDLKPNSADDARVRLFGTNLAFGGNFPTAQDAARIARRLRRLGFNLVRLHHMDTQPDGDPNRAESILTLGPFPAMNTVALARLRAFLTALRQEGIYANLNLHVGYTFRPGVDGVPSPWDSGAFPLQSKPLHMILPRLITLQQQFAKGLIEGLQLRDDPVLAMVEINNESSLLHSWQVSEIDWYVARDYATEWSRQWNRFLLARYPSTDVLRRTWGETQPDGPNLLSSNWELEVHYPSQATLVTSNNGGVPTAVVKVAQGGAPVIAKQVGFSVKVDALYTAEAEMRADLPDGVTRTVYWDIKQDVDPYRTQSGQFVQVGNQWQKFRMAFQPQFNMESIGRMGLSVEQVDVPISIRNGRVAKLGPRGLGQNESLEAGTVIVPSAFEAATDTRTNDYLSFLVQQDRAYLNSILTTVRESAGPLALVTGTQVGYGGLLNLDSHNQMDYLDNHFYIDHYIFPHEQWDWNDWGILDKSSLDSGFSEFLGMAASRQSGVPYTVSEYNQPWPNRHAAELGPALAAFAAFQDWDGLVHFAYSHDQDWEATYPHGFNLNGDWTKVPGMGQSAWLYRTGAIGTGQNPLDIPLPLADRLRAGREKRDSSVSGFLSDALGYDPMNALQRRVRLVKDGTGPAPTGAAIPGAPIAADTGQFTFDRSSRIFKVHADRAAGVLGFVGRDLVSAGSVDFELASGKAQFASVLLTALDGRSISESRRMLLSLPGHTLRTKPGTDPLRPQALIGYPNIDGWWTLEADRAGKPSGDLNNGRGPVWMERIESYLTVRTSASGLKVHPLNGAGGRLDPLGENDVKPVDGGYRIHLQADGQAFSPWYELAGDQ